MPAKKMIPTPARVAWVTLRVLQEVLEGRRRITDREFRILVRALETLSGKEFSGAAKSVATSFLPPNILRIDELVWEAVFRAFLAVLSECCAKRVSAIFPADVDGQAFSSPEKVAQHYDFEGDMHGSIYRALDFLAFYPNQTSHKLACRALQNFFDMRSIGLINSPKLPVELWEFFQVLSFWDNSTVLDFSTAAALYFKQVPISPRIWQVK